MEGGEGVVGDVGGLRGGGDGAGVAARDREVEVRVMDEEREAWVAEDRRMIFWILMTLTAVWLVSQIYSQVIDAHHKSVVCEQPTMMGVSDDG